MGVALLVHYTARQSEHTAAEKEVARAEQEELAPGLATAGSPRAPRGENVPRSTRRCRRLTRGRLSFLASFNATGGGVFLQIYISTEVTPASALKRRRTRTSQVQRTVGRRRSPSSADTLEG